MSWYGVEKDLINAHSSPPPQRAPLLSLYKILHTKSNFLMAIGQWPATAIKSEVLFRSLGNLAARWPSLYFWGTADRWWEFKDKMCEPEAERCYRQLLEATCLVWLPQVVAIVAILVIRVIIAIVVIVAFVVICVILRCYPQQLEATWLSGCHQTRKLPTPHSDGNQLAS